MADSTPDYNVWIRLKDGTRKGFRVNKATVELAKRRAIELAGEPIIIEDIQLAK